MGSQGGRGKWTSFLTGKCLYEVCHRDHPLSHLKRSGLYCGCGHTGRCTKTQHSFQTGVIKVCASTKQTQRSEERVLNLFVYLGLLSFPLPSY